MVKAGAKRKMSKKKTVSRGRGGRGRPRAGNGGPEGADNSAADFTKFMQQNYQLSKGYNYPDFWAAVKRQRGVRVKFNNKVIKFYDMPFISKDTLESQTSRCFCAFLSCPKMQCQCGRKNKVTRLYCLVCGPLCEECRRKTHISADPIFAAPASSSTSGSGSSSEPEPKKRISRNANV